MDFGVKLVEFKSWLYSFSHVNETLCLIISIYKIETRIIGPPWSGEDEIS